MNIADDYKRRTLKAMADIGSARGFRASAEVLRALARSRKQIAASELIACAETLANKARELERDAIAAVPGLENVLR